MHPDPIDARPRVSVVIPLGSVDELLYVQLDAVLAQVLVEPFEVVLSVNSADPAVSAALDDVEAHYADPRVRRVDSSDARGAAHARNAGVAGAVGDVIAFCDGDDRVHAGWLAELVAALETADAACGRVVDIFPDPKMASWRPPATEGALPTFLGVPYVLSGNMAIRREWFERVGGFDEHLTRCEDIAIGWSLVRAGARLAYVDAAVLDYRHRAGVVPMLKQHYLYGKGMAEVLSRDGVPSTDGAFSAEAGALKMLRPNGQRVARRTAIGTMRRVALGVGRVAGIAQERRRTTGVGSVAGSKGRS